MHACVVRGAGASLALQALSLTLLMPVSTSTKRETYPVPLEWKSATCASACCWSIEYSISSCSLLTIPAFANDAHGTWVRRTSSLERAPALMRLAEEGVDLLISGADSAAGMHSQAGRAQTQRESRVPPAGLRREGCGGGDALDGKYLYGRVARCGDVAVHTVHSYIE